MNTQTEPRTKTLKNGAVYNLDDKRIVANPGGGSTAITQANASALAKKRWENYRRAAVKAIIDEAKSIDTEASTGAAAFGLVAAKQFTTLMDSDKPAIDQLEKLGKIMTGLTGENSQRDHTPPGAISGSPQALAELVTLLEAERAAAVDRGRAVDGQVKP
jgi:hypothetical protein